MKNIRVYKCEDSIEGILTAINQAWNSRYGHSNIKIEEQCKSSDFTNMELFSEYVTVKTDFELALKVSKAVKDKISEEAYQMVCRVAVSNHQGKADLIYRFMILGFEMGANIMNHLSHEVVNKVFKINRFVNYEIHHFLGFVRFSEQNNGLLTSCIHPKNNILSFIVPHFEDRMQGENFMILDDNRKLAAIHMKNKPWMLIEAEDILKEHLNDFSNIEDEYQNLWKTFFNQIAIKERINPKLQRNMLPLRFRSDMTEFNTD